jgi:hypothetical protein
MEGLVIPMLRNDTLLLHEEVLLLSLKDKEGTIASGTMYQYAIGGAILSELLLRQRIKVDGSKRKKLVDLDSAAPVGEPLIDECLGRIAEAKRRAALKTWVSRFATVKKLKHRLAEQLCKRGILKADKGEVLRIFTRKIYPEVNPVPEKKIIERLRKAIFTETNDVDPRTVVLVSIADRAGLLKVVFDKKKLKSRKKRIENIVNGEMTGKATKEAIEAMQAAVWVAVFVATS